MSEIEHIQEMTKEEHEASEPTEREMVLLNQRDEARTKLKAAEDSLYAERAAWKEQRKIAQTLSKKLKVAEDDNYRMRGILHRHHICRHCGNGLLRADDDSCDCHRAKGAGE